MSQVLLSWTPLTVSMYLNTFENTFPKKQKNHILKKNLENTIETRPNYLSIFMLL